MGARPNVGQKFGLRIRSTDYAKTTDTINSPTSTSNLNLKPQPQTSTILHPTMFRRGLSGFRATTLPFRPAIPGRLWARRFCQEENDPHKPEQLPSKGGDFDSRLRALGSDTKSRFDKMESRFDKMESRFDKMESRFESSIRYVFPKIGKAIGDIKEANVSD
jgi:hypothetical protein